MVDVFVDVIRTSGRAASEVSALSAEEREARRLAERQEAMRRREQKRVRSFAATGSGLLAGGVASMFLPTVAAVGVGFLAAGAASLLIRAVQSADWSGLADRLRPKPSVPGLHEALDPPEVNGRNLPKSQRELAQRILDEVAGDLRRVDAVRRSIAGTDAVAAESCRRLIEVGGRLSDAVAESPGKLSCAQRAFTYFLPEAARIAEQMSAFAAQKDEKNLLEARSILARTELVLEKAMLAMSGLDLAEANVGMRLVNQALDEELNDGTPRR